MPYTFVTPSKLLSKFMEDLDEAISNKEKARKVLEQKHRKEEDALCKKHDKEIEDAQKSLMNAAVGVQLSPSVYYYVTEKELKDLDKMQDISDLLPPGAGGPGGLDDDFVRDFDTVRRKPISAVDTPRQVLAHVEPRFGKDSPQATMIKKLAGG